MALTPTEREEHFFKAMVDSADGSTPEELEPTERKEHWYKEIIDAIAAGGGGSGGGGVLVVHDVDGTLDKTWAEIDATDVAVIVSIISAGGVTAHLREIVIGTVLSDGYYHVDARGEGKANYLADSADGYPVRQ